MAVSKIRETKLETGPVTAILCIDDSTLLLSTPHSIYKHDLKSTNNTFKLVYTGAKYIPDMTRIQYKRFAFVDQGTWFFSSIFKCDESGKITTFDTDTYCSGIEYYDRFYYLTFSLRHFLKSGDSGYIKVTDTHGYELRTIRNDKNDQAVFGKDISKLYVASDNKMYLADLSNMSFRVFNLCMETGKISPHKKFGQMVINDIIKKGDKLYLVLGGDRQEIVQMEGARPLKFLKHHHLNAEPTAACFAGQELFVATKYNPWFLWDPEYHLKLFTVNPDFCDDHTVNF